MLWSSLAIVSGCDVAWLAHSSRPGLLCCASGAGWTRVSGCDVAWLAHSSRPGLLCCASGAGWTKQYRDNWCAVWSSLTKASGCGVLWFSLVSRPGLLCEIGCLLSKVSGCCAVRSTSTPVVVPDEDVCWEGV